MKQTSFSGAEFVSKKRLTRRERFLAEIEAARPWPALVAALLPYYPKGDGRGRPPMGLGYARCREMCSALNTATKPVDSTRSRSGMARRPLPQEGTQNGILASFPQGNAYP